MRPQDRAKAVELEQRLTSFNHMTPMPGIITTSHRECFIEQLIDSIRRVRYISLLNERSFGPEFSDSNSDLFDPQKAAIWHFRNGNIDESFWLIFLSTHFGKHRVHGWNLSRHVFGGLGGSTPWNWNSTSQNVSEFRQWLGDNQENLRSAGWFGSHRTRESLSNVSQNGTGAVIESYVNWVGNSRSHEDLISRAKINCGDDSKMLFRYLYNNMKVRRFGRLGKFDYLTMVGKVNLVNIEPDSTYMKGATGPLEGARLLFGGRREANLSIDELDEWLVQLDSHLGLYFGMQVLEDALCNWQKNPANFIHFVG